ncbi:MAG: hypothetical protein U0L51_08315, partial [Olegusella sp.]|nr:hypothetical protein [Olegusella sp.]
WRTGKVSVGRSAAQWPLPPGYGWLFSFGWVGWINSASIGQTFPALTMASVSVSSAVNRAEKAVEYAYQDTEYAG